MTKPVLIALAQLNAHLGNVNANVSRLAEARTQAASHGAEIIVFVTLGDSQPHKPSKYNGLSALGSKSVTDTMV